MSEQCDFDKDLIVNQKDFEFIESYVTCIICTEGIEEPTQCSKCENCFCKKCIDQWMTKSHTCPFKCDNPKFFPSIETQEMLNKLKFNCTKCSGSFLYQTYKEHFRNCTKEKDNKIGVIKLIGEKVFLLKLDRDQTEMKSKETIEKAESINNKKKREIDNLKHDVLLLQRAFRDMKGDNNICNAADGDCHFYSTKHKLHPGMLVKTCRVGWNCDICRETHSSKDRSYYCTLCDYDVCIKCKQKEEENEMDKLNNSLTKKCKLNS